MLSGGLEVHFSIHTTLFISEPRGKSVRHIKTRFVSRLAASHEYPNYNDNTRVQVQLIVVHAGISLHC